MPQTHSERDIVEVLAEDFVARHRRGERPSLTEYENRCPDRAHEIRELFPALIVIERLKPTDGSNDGFSDVTQSCMPERLGDYRILREVGHGGMGTVYEAEQVSLGRHVAVKVLSAGRRMDARTRQRFEREAKAAARLHHTNIVPVFGVGDHEGMPYYVMQFINGLALDEVIGELRRLRDRSPGQSADGSSTPMPHGDLTAAAVAQSLMSGHFDAFAETITVDHSGGKAVKAGQDTQAFEAAKAHSSSSIRILIPDAGRHSGQSSPHYWRSVARLGVQVADALAYAHSQGVLHRDIKPSNLLFDMEGTVWVADFGMAKADDQQNLTQTGDILGTMRYMPPEAFDGKADARGDVYSLGLTMYELLAFRPAFQESDRNKLIKQVTHHEPVPLGRFNALIPKDLITIVHKSIERDPAQRYQSAAELADDLKSLLEDRPIRARRASQLEKAWRWCRRNPAVSSLGAAVVLLLVLMTAGSLWFAAWRGQQLEKTRRVKDQETAARKDTQDLLRASYLTQARADRWSGRAGRRFLALDAISKAMKIESEKPPTLLELRNEAIASLAYADINIRPNWTGTILHDGAAFTPDFEHYATWARHVGAVIVCRRNAEHDGQEVARFPALKDSIWPIEFSPDGRFLAYTSRGPEDDGKTRHRIEVWDWRQSTRLWARTHTQVAAMNLVFSPDSSAIAVSINPRETQVYNLATGDELMKFACGGAVAFNPNGESVLFRNGNALELRACKPGGPEAKTLAFTGGTVFDGCWSPDGRLMGVASENKLAYIYDAHSWRLRQTLVGHKAQVNRIYFSTDSQLVFTTDYLSTLRVWEAQTGRLLLVGPCGPVYLSRDGKWFGHAYGTEGRICEIASGSEYREMHGHTCFKGPDDLQFSPDGSFLASAGTDGVRLWDPASSKQLAHIPANGHFVRLSPKGDALFISDRKGLNRWPIRHDRAATTIRIGPPEKLRDPPVDRLDLSRDGQWIALTDYRSGQAEVRSMVDTNKRVFFSGLPELDAALISPDNRWLAAGGWPAEWRKVFDLQSQRCVHEFPPSYFAFSPDSKWLLIADRDAPRLWEVGTWKPGPEIPAFRSSRSVPRAAFSPDGAILAVTRQDPVIQLFKVETMEELCTLESPTPESCGPMTFNADGSQLTVSVAGRVIQRWDLRRIREQLKPMGLDWPMPDYLPAPAHQSFQIEIVNQ